MKRLDLFLHLTRLLGPVVALVVVQHSHPLVWVALTVAVHLASFSFAHDVAHGALGLPRKANEWVLALSALPMLVSGHSMRLMHQVHHARPLSAGDLEGEGATMSLGRALVIGPRNAVALRLKAARVANAREQRWIVAESLACLALLVAALATASPMVLTWLAVSVTLQLTMSAWASHLPHRPPKALVRVARKLTWTKSATVLSFAFHEAHHARPKVPCRSLS